MKTLQDFANEVEMSVQRATVLSGGTWPIGTRKFSIQLTRNGVSVTVPYHMGPALEGEPDKLDLLDCLAVDSQAGEMSFQDFVREFGYDYEDDQASMVHAQCIRNSRLMQRLFGEEYNDFVMAQGEDGHVV